VRSKQAILIFCLSVAASFFYHGLNWRALSESNPEGLRKGVSVATSDDPSYLAPVENFMAGKGWQSNAIGRAAWLSRSPGYGMIYGFWRLFLSEKSALVALILFQILLWAFALTNIPKIFQYFTVPYGFGVAIFMACWPAFGGFLSYTLTEGVSPALTLLLFSAAISASPGDVWWRVGPIGALILLVRPSLLPIALVVPIFLLLSLPKLQVLKSAAALLIILLPILGWQVYISVRAGQLQSLHPIYQTDTNDLYRPLHGDIWNFHKSWGQEGHAFHRQMEGIWTAASTGSSTRDAAGRVVAELPVNVQSSVGEQALLHAYISYGEILGQQQPFVIEQSPIPGLLPGEGELSLTFQDFTQTYRRAHWFNFAVFVPAKVFIRMSAHSNLNLYLFQGFWRGNWMIEIIRFLSFCLHFGIFLLFPVAAYYLRRQRIILLLSASILAYQAYLLFVQRGIEERYTAAIFPIMAILVIIAISSLAKNLRLKHLKD